MIEILIKYIRDKGYEVDVIPGALIIRKCVNAELDEICSVGWFISKYDMRPDMEEMLYYMAQKKMGMIDKAIAERKGAAGDAGVDAAPRMG